ncbi:DUF1345 domain-containing protein [Leucobacter sp. UT-8R-CII-1-4]|uniref:DUF1345 domain-containing protein n=1 Tax=Leucobacter sp. UT-8R-CII-1-4 TaxID=3040075 RepID=UPI0024A8824C|nr:DUF1345 domain-containing protein [Leucobacter sp. UT-8R-CII-1-4]MDI6023596.1 DUF1345 domain-containing protein [Leucobacter sp. UT-8R-CII-1-4]
MTATQPTRQQRSGSRSITVVIEVVGILAQLLLLYVGLIYLFNEETEPLADLVYLFAWCVVATLYLAGTVFWLNIDLRINRDDHRFLRETSRNPLIAWFSTIATFTASLVGLSAAISLVSEASKTDAFHVYELVAVWAMLASWAMFHWGYSRIYYAAYQKYEADQPLHFPGTEQPRLIDFVYFSFTNGTSFSPSDVSVRTSRMRWTVVWHTTFSFFFNALIIVLTMNTISGGFALL